MCPGKPQNVPWEAPKCALGPRRRLDDDDPDDDPADDDDDDDSHNGDDDVAQQWMAEIGLPMPNNHE